MIPYKNMIKKPNFSFQSSLFILNIILLLALTIFPHVSLQDSPYVCPYPCLPPPTEGSTNPPVTPALPPPSTPTTTTNCPPPPSQPTYPTYYNSPPPPRSYPGQYYYYSPPPPNGYTPSYEYYPPSGGYPYGNAPPPPNPILPYFPYYFKNPPPAPQDMSSATRVMSINMMNQFHIQGSFCWVMIILSTVALHVWR